MTLQRSGVGAGVRPENKTVAGVIRAKLDDLQISAREAAQRHEFEKSFFARLVSGQQPPRTRKNRRMAKDDPRYRNIAESLGIEDVDAFLELVESEQRGRQLVGTERRVGLFQKAWACIEPMVALNIRDEVLLLVKLAVDAARSLPAVEDLLAALSEKLPPDPSPPLSHLPVAGYAPAVVHSFLGETSDWLPVLFSQIAQVFIGLTDDEADALDTRLAVARVFYRLASLDPQHWREAQAIIAESTRAV